MHHYSFLDSKGEGVPLGKVRTCAINVVRADSQLEPLKDDEPLTHDDRIAMTLVENQACYNDGKTVDEVIQQLADKKCDLVIAILVAIRDTLDVRSFSCYRS